MKLILKKKKINIIYYTKFKDKLLGFMFKKNFDYALRFKCKAIQTFFMKENIDVIITDKNNKILYIYPNLKKNRILIKLKSYYFYELPANTNTYKVNEILKIIS